MGKNIAENLEKVVAYSQEYPFPIDTSEIYKQWLKSKKKFIEAFHGETFWRSPTKIKIELSSTQKKAKINEFIDTLKSNYIPPDFEKFIKNNENTFFDNVVSCGDPAKAINEGAKLSRAFRKFFPSEAETRAAQDLASVYMQENKLEGYLYLSVDPLDFLSMSDTNENWRSCHSLDGSYRSGNLSYMLDETTLVAFVATDEMQQLDAFPQGLLWNSKKWRMLIHVNDKDVIYYNKQYPFTSGVLLRQAHDSLTNLLELDNYPPREYGFKLVNQSDKQHILDFNQVSIRTRVFDARDLIDTDEYEGYCDLVNSFSYIPVISLPIESYKEFLRKDCFDLSAEYKSTKDLIGLKIGKSVKCVACGKNNIHHGNSFLCDDCIEQCDAYEDYFPHCGCCGRRTKNKKSYWVEMEECEMCENCYTDYLDQGGY